MQHIYAEAAIVKCKLEHGHRVEHGPVVAYCVNRLSGHSIMSAACKAIMCQVFDIRVYFLPRDWQRYI